MKTKSVRIDTRQMCISYNQAVSLIDELEKRGVIGPKRQGWPTREVQVVMKSDLQEKIKGTIKGDLLWNCY